jgi:hypothetical protein
MTDQTVPIMPSDAAIERPNRWLHVRLPRPLSEAEWTIFEAQARIFARYVAGTLGEWTALGHDYDPPAYVFFAPELSADRTVATLPIGGGWSVGTRALFENGASFLLWQHFPHELQMEIEEGLSEPHDGVVETAWRPAHRREVVAGETAGFLGHPGSEHPSALDRVRRALWWVSGVLPPG